MRAQYHRFFNDHRRIVTNFKLDCFVDNFRYKFNAKKQHITGDRNLIYFQFTGKFRSPVKKLQIYELYIRIYDDCNSIMRFWWKPQFTFPAHSLHTL